MKIEKLQEIVDSAAAIRYRVRLQPAGGPGDKIFPPTYEGGKYAEEKRKVDGQSYNCVHLDSVQSQANRMELALLEAHRNGLINIPLIEVDFPAKAKDLNDIGIISSLEAPHRIADAIIRDSVSPDGISFRETTEGRILNTASTVSATGLFGLCPTALLFGLWDSTGPMRRGSGVKFQRAIVSELVAINTEQGVKTASRLDPLGITIEAGPLYKDPTTNGWTLDAKGKDGKPLEKIGNSGKPSEANHGNVTPGIEQTNGGVTFDYALQSMVISLPALRRLRFPIDGEMKPAADLAARTVLAALGLCAASLSIEKGYDLRSRCLLVPEHPGEWAVIGSNGSTEKIDLDAKATCLLLGQAVTAANEAGLPWRSTPLRLIPSDGLAKLVTRNRQVLMQATEGE